MTLEKVIYGLATLAEFTQKMGSNYAYVAISLGAMRPECRRKNDTLSSGFVQNLRVESSSISRKSGLCIRVVYSLKISDQAQLTAII